MLFRVYDHYRDCNEKQLDLFISDNTQSVNVPEDCFICYEYKIENELTPIQLKNQNIYEKICHCNGWIHNDCLDKWIKIYNQCPICRTVLDDENENDDEPILFPDVNGDSRIRIFCRRVGEALLLTLKIYSALFLLLIIISYRDLYISTIELF
jgi:hypothetical protein